MKRLPVLLLIGCIVIAAAASLLLQQGGRSEEHVWDPSAPQHLFIAATEVPPDAQQCDFSMVETGERLFRMWSRPLQDCTIGPGWTHPSDAGIRAFGYRPSIEVHVSGEELELLVLTAKGLRHPASGKPQSADIFVNGEAIAHRELPDEWSTIAVELPPGTIHRGTNRIEFGFAHRVPSAAGNAAGRDPRRFAADLLDLTLAKRPADEPGDSGHREVMRAAGQRLRETIDVWDPEDGLFRIDRAGRLYLPFEAPPDSNALAMELHARGHVDPASAGIEVAVRVVESGASWSPALPPWLAEEGGGGFRLSGTIPVARCAGVRCVMTLEIRPGGAVVEIRPPTPVVAAKAANPRSPASTPVRATAGLPDIILVTLDAARFDHFSHVGYARPTTPNIDRLAAESLVFTNAFALAPYTMCSVPTMLSGLSFLEHGVTDRGRFLAPEALTLAEALRAEGYRTVAFSTNPNNSRATGTDQGYDEFHEMWTDESLHDIVDPQVLTGRALEVLASHDSSRPLHLQLHYMPPHAPYAPAAEYDLFSDPGYQGPCDGSHRTINRLDAGRLSPDAGCLEHVIALYDGGLLAADAAVGRLLDALRARPRWNETIVLVTSDHGEAFLEHGRTSHNSTVFDEMLHVPFILRLPGRLERSSVDTDQLATLADILPTLLSAAALAAPQGIDGLDLLAPADPSVSRDRYLIARTTGAAPTYGLRTLGWKLILPGSGHGALYNVGRDPLERDNRRFIAEPVYVALGQLLTARLAAPRTPPGTVEKGELSDADREMLEALGYVE